MIDLPNVSVVVIGYNESDNLERTFSSIINMTYPSDMIDLIYVDSGSFDNSIEIAKNYTDRVFIEDKFPTAGKNRNRGLVEAKHEIVHFIDGDVTIDKNYLRNIVHLFEKNNVQAIVGQLDEQNPNIYNRMAALSNADETEGYTQFTCTGATYIKSALLAVNGYDERIRRGQESELGERFRTAGFKIWCTIHKMGSHNFNVNNLWQYVQKYKVNAKSLFQLVFLKGESIYIKSAKTKVFKAFIKLLLFIIVLIISLFTNTILPIFLYLLLSWIIRNKLLFIERFKSEPYILTARLAVDFLFYWMWWIGFFDEMIDLALRKKYREFYSLRKEILLRLLRLTLPL